MFNGYLKTFYNKYAKVLMKIPVVNFQENFGQILALDIVATKQIEKIRS